MASVETIFHDRDTWLPQTTLGLLRINDKRFCWTLEDTVRAYGIKVQDHTAFPANPNSGYKVGVRHSAHFDREVVVIYTEEDGITLAYAEISFEYIYAHGGNRHKNTRGCCLVGYHKDGNTIYGSAEAELLAIVKGWLAEGKEIRWVTTNILPSR